MIEDLSKYEVSTAGAKKNATVPHRQMSFSSQQFF
jgi:hypothetical protein